MSAILKNIAIIGASGSVGKPTLEELLKIGKHSITVISRKSSQAVFPAGVRIEKGEYDDDAFMKSALAGQDVLIIMLGFPGLPQQDLIVQQASKAGVMYVLPCEYGMDSQNDKACEISSMIQDKRDVQIRIKELGMKFIAVVTNFWTDYMIAHNAGGFNLTAKRATVHPGTYRWHTTTQAQVGRGIAAMLSLPAATIEKDFANGWLYLTSFHVTHEEMFQAILTATNSTESKWQVERKPAKQLLEEGQVKLKAGDRSGVWDVLHGATFAEGYGGEYSREPHNVMLGLPEEDLVDVVRQAAKEVR
ncbi:hypothetical protein PRZ48_006688 [Zasmidium cellare]|uniref:NmrA-like domain-containing protein n=1 Tax=Zasmidium cellare TaxID=395010 RepID=A0ABR0EPT3_ZASCE|nr:hypothetical protein PRZ48_006688 [Zasmidium cellare]